MFLFFKKFICGLNATRGKSPIKNILISMEGLIEATSGYLLFLFLFITPLVTKKIKMILIL